MFNLGYANYSTHVFRYRLYAATRTLRFVVTILCMSISAPSLVKADDGAERAPSEDIVGRIDELKKQIEDQGELIGKLEERVKSIEDRVDIKSGRVTLTSLQAGSSPSQHSILDDDAKPGVYIISYDFEDIAAESRDEQNRIDYVVFSPISSGNTGSKSLDVMQCGRPPEGGRDYVGKTNYSVTGAASDWDLRVGVNAINDNNIMSDIRVIANWVRISPRRDDPSEGKNREGVTE